MWDISLEQKIGLITDLMSSGPRSVKGYSAVYTGISFPVTGQAASLWILEFAVLGFACSNLGCGGEGHKEEVLWSPSEGCVVFILR